MTLFAQPNISFDFLQIGPIGNAQTLPEGTIQKGARSAPYILFTETLSVSYFFNFENSPNKITRVLHDEGSREFGSRELRDHP